MDNVCYTDSLSNQNVNRFKIENPHKNRECVKDLKFLIFEKERKEME